jgi:hypothetical protein
VARLKDEVDGKILVFGSRTLVQMLLGHKLVDGLRLFEFGAMVSGGGRMLEAGAPESSRLSDPSARRRPAVRRLRRRPRLHRGGGRSRSTGDERGLELEVKRCARARHELRRERRIALDPQRPER